MQISKGFFLSKLKILKPQLTAYEYAFDDYYTLKLSRCLSGGKHFRFRDLVNSLVQIFLIPLKLILIRQSDPKLPRFLFTRLNSKSHLRLLVENTLPSMPLEQCGILAFSESWDFEGYHIIDGSTLFYSHGKLADFFEALRIWSEIGSVLKSIGVFNPSSMYFNVWLEIILVHIRSSIAYEAYVRLLAQSEVRAIVVEYDHNTQYVPLLLAAKKYNIRSYTFQHGLINCPGGYDPVIADRILVWGDFFRDTLLSYGVPDAKIAVTGCQSISDPALEHQVDANLKIIYATTAYGVRQRLETATGVSQALDKCTEFAWQFCIKKHPSDRILYAIEENAPDFLIGMSTVESLPWCDILICHNSTIALEALRQGKLLILVDFTDVPLTDSIKRLENFKCCLVARSPMELASILRQASSITSEIRATIERGYNLSKQLYAEIGRKAGGNAAEFILEESKNDDRK
jgi:hypothetical protein